MPEEEVPQVEESGGKKKKSKVSIMPIITSAIVAAAISYLILIFMAPRILSSNVANQEKSNPPGTTQLVQPREISAVLISPGSNETFPLKGADQVVVVDFLIFKVGSDACRAAIADKSHEIMDALSKIFFSKEKSELSTGAGIELLKRQIKEAANMITGFVGDKEPYGVINVYIRIKAFASTE
ncbi:MAG: flagellar basal body-associated FliL family protein [Thermotogaceae bacterium]|nr:flagellar basal body-associated FliL family protein [Thermotogaceae bacterium]